MTKSPEERAAVDIAVRGRQWPAIKACPRFGAASARWWDLPPGGGDSWREGGPAPAAAAHVRALGAAAVPRVPRRGCPGPPGALLERGGGRRTGPHSGRARGTRRGRALSAGGGQEAHGR